jgi:four helix bundle protein
MEQQPRKVYVLREKLFAFACGVIRAAQKLHTKDRIAGALTVQLVSAAMNAASNCEEADDGSSIRDFVAKQRIGLREVKEANLRLRVLQATGYLSPGDETLIQESSELVRIIAKTIHNAQRNQLDR